MTEPAYLKAAREAFEGPQRPPRWRLRRPIILRISRVVRDRGRHPDCIQYAPGLMARSVTVQVAGWQIVIGARWPIWRA